MLKEDDIDMDAYCELYEHLQEGMDDVASGRTVPFDAFMSGLRKDMKDGKLWD